MLCFIVCAVRIIAGGSIHMCEISRINEDNLELAGAVEAEQDSVTCRDREPEI
jgi:hypothetical protein